MQSCILFTHFDELTSQILVLFLASPEHTLTMLIHFPKLLYFQLMLGLDDLLLSLKCFLNESLFQRSSNMRCILRIFCKVTVPFIGPILRVLGHLFMLIGPYDYVRFDLLEFLLILAMQLDEWVIEVKSCFEFILEKVPLPPELYFCDHWQMFRIVFELMDELLNGFESFIEKEGWLRVVLGCCLGILSVGDVDRIEYVRGRGRMAHCYNKFVIN